MATRSHRVVWTARARADLDAILDYVAEDSPDAAHKLLDVVLQTADSLHVLSKRGRVVPEVDDENLREVFIYSYRMMYRLDKDVVAILAILHGARDFGRWMRRPAEE